MRDHAPLIRQAARSDLAALVKLERACFGTGALPPISLVQYLELFPSTCLVAEGEASRIIGFAAGGAALEEAECGWLLDVAVDPSARGRGIATLLLGELVRRLEKMGVRRVFATVSPGNAASAAVLRKAGFVNVRREDDYFGEGEARDVVALDL